MASIGHDRVSAISDVVHIDDDIKFTLTEAADAPGGTAQLTAAIDASIAELQKEGKITNKLAQRLKFANEVASISHDNLGLMKALDTTGEVNSLRDFALTHSILDFAPLLSDPSPQAPVADM